MYEDELNAVNFLCLKFKCTCNGVHVCMYLRFYFHATLFSRLPLSLFGSLASTTFITIPGCAVQPIFSLVACLVAGSCFSRVNTHESRLNGDEKNEHETNSTANSVFQQVF